MGMDMGMGMMGYDGWGMGMPAMYDGWGMGKGAAMQQEQGRDECGPIADVRFDDPSAVEFAVEMTGTPLHGQPITVKKDLLSKDGTKVIVSGLIPSTHHEELKQLFSPCGVVVFAGKRRPRGVKGAPAAPDAYGGFSGGMKGVKMPFLKQTQQWGSRIPQPIAKGKSGGGSRVAEVRFDTMGACEMALALDGSYLAGARISVEWDHTSQEGTKVKVGGIPPGVEWQDLKDHFAMCGQVAFVNIESAKGAKGGGGGGKGGGGKGGGGAKGVKGGPPGTGEVRFEGPDAQAAAQNSLELDGSLIGDCVISVDLDPTCKEKVIIRGLPLEAEWQELKDVFKPYGNVAFTAVAKGGGKGGKRIGIGEVRYSAPESASMAVSNLTGSVLSGESISCSLDEKSKDGTKIVVRGLAADVTWEELKDLCSTVGEVAFCNIR